MLNPSPRLKKEAARIGCNPNHIILADLILSGYTDSEAYDIAFSEDIAKSAKSIIADRERELKSDGYKRAYEERRMANRSNTEPDDLRNKESVARELNKLITQTTDPKLRAELLMKLADLQQMKKDLTSLDDDPVQFFLPLACEKCPLLQNYNEFLAEKNRDLPPDKWDLEVRPDEMQRIIEQSDTDIRQMRKKERDRQKGA